MSTVKALLAHSYIGTLIQACKNEGVDVLASLEDDAFGSFTKTSAAIQRHNWPETQVLEHKSRWPTAAQMPTDNMWFLAAQPPCAGGSMVTPSASRGGLDNPKSAFHVTAGFMKYAYSLRAPIIAIESVPGTLKICGGDLKKIRDEHAPEYGITFVLDNSMHYGCVSIRKRLWHIHYRKDLFPNGIEFTRGPGIARSTADALANVEGLPNHVTSNTQQSVYNKHALLFQAMGQGDYANNFLRKSGRWDMVPPETIKTKTNGEKYVFYEATANKRLAWDQPAPTITGSTFLVHPDGSRPLTTREYLRINNMPDTFSFPDSVGVGKQITYIGKTVSVGIAQWVIDNIKKNLETLA